MRGGSGCEDVAPAADPRVVVEEALFLAGFTFWTMC